MSVPSLNVLRLPGKGVLKRRFLIITIHPLKKNDLTNKLFFFTVTQLMLSNFHLFLNIRFNFKKKK